MGHDGQLVVDFAALHQAAADIQRAINKLRSDLDQLNSEAQPLVSTWAGEAQQAYQVRQQTWTNAATDLSQMLSAIERALVDSTSDYNTTEKTNTGLFQ
jgi:6 kDa early secretory antigenic target